MADTQRTLAALQTLFADNDVGDIDAQDLRDFLVSTQASVGISYVSASAETTINTVDVWEAVAGTYAQVAANRFTVGSDGKLTYTGAPDIGVFLLASVSTTSPGSNKIFEWAFSHYTVSDATESVVTSTIIRRKVGTGSDVGALALFGYVTMTQNDYVRLFVRNTTDNINVEAVKAFVFAYGGLT